MLDGLDVGLDHQIARHDDGARKRQQHHQAKREPANDQQRPQPGAQLVLIGTAGPQHDALARRAGNISRAVAIDEECNALGHALAGFIDHPPGGTFGHDGAGRNRRGQAGGLDTKRVPHVVRRRDLQYGPRPVLFRRPGRGL